MDQLSDGDALRREESAKMHPLKRITTTALLVFHVAAMTNSVGVAGCGEDFSDGAVLDTFKTFEGEAIVQTRYNSI